MADTPIVRINEVEPNVQVRKLWCEQQIAEKECAVKRLEADAEEILRGRIKKIQADILMTKRKIAELYKQRDSLDGFHNEDVIDVNLLELKKEK
jgi:hypothetical protein